MPKVAWHTWHFPRRRPRPLWTEQRQTAPSLEGGILLLTQGQWPHRPESTPQSSAYCAPSEG